MRSSVLTVLAGVTAAFFFSSIFVHFALGQIFFPLCTLPLFLIFFMLPHREIWLALAGSGATLGLLSLTGFAGPTGVAIGLIISFIFTAALPALLVGSFYARPFEIDEEGTPVTWMPVEVAVILLCFLSLLLFYTSYALAQYVADKSMYEVIYQLSLDYVRGFVSQVASMNATDLTDINPETLALETTLRMPGVLIFMFMVGHLVNLLFAQHIARRRYMTDQPMPNLGNIFFPYQFLLFFMLSYGAYLYGDHAAWPPERLFALAPAVVAFGIPLFLQGVSTFHRVFLLKLVKVGRLSVYLGLFFGFLALAKPMVMVFTLVGAINNAIVFVQRKV